MGTSNFQSHSFPSILSRITISRSPPSLSHQKNQQQYEQKISSFSKKPKSSHLPGRTIATCNKISLNPIQLAKHEKPRYFVTIVRISRCATNCPQRGTTYDGGGGYQSHHAVRSPCWATHIPYDCPVPELRHEETYARGEEMPITTRLAISEIPIPTLWAANENLLLTDSAVRKPKIKGRKANHIPPHVLRSPKNLGNRRTPITSRVRSLALGHTHFL